MNHLFIFAVADSLGAWFVPEGNSPKRLKIEGEDKITFNLKAGNLRSAVEDLAARLKGHPEPIGVRFVADQGGALAIAQGLTSEVQFLSAGDWELLQWERIRRRYGIDAQTPWEDTGLHELHGRVLATLVADDLPTEIANLKEAHASELGELHQLNSNLACKMDALRMQYQLKVKRMREELELSESQRTLWRSKAIQRKRSLTQREAEVESLNKALARVEAKLRRRP